MEQKEGESSFSFLSEHGSPSSLNPPPPRHKHGTCPEEQLQYKKLSYFSSLPETTSELSEPEPVPVLPRFTDVSDHQIPWLWKPAPRNVFTSEEEKSARDGLCSTYSIGEEPKDNTLYDFLCSSSETPSEMKKPEPLSSLTSFKDVPGHQRRYANTASKKRPLRTSTRDHILSENANPRSLNAPPKRHKLGLCPEELEYIKLSNFRSPFETPSELNEPESVPDDFSWIADVFDHQTPWLWKPAPRNVFTSEEEKSARDGSCSTYSTGEEPKDNTLSDFCSSSETPSEMNKPEALSSLTSFKGVLDNQRRYANTASKHSPLSLKAFTGDHSLSEKGSSSFLNTFPKRRKLLPCSTYSTEEQLKDNKLFSSPTETPSEMNEPEPGSEYGRPSFLNPPPTRPFLGLSWAYSPGESQKESAYIFPVPSESEPRGDHSALEGMGHYSSDSPWRVVDLSSPTTSAKNTPDVTVDTDSTHSDMGLSVYSNTRPHPQFLSTPPPPSKRSSFMRIDGLFKKKFSGIESTFDYSDYLLAQPPPGTLRETGMIESHSSVAGGTPGVNQDDTRDMELDSRAGPSTLQLSTSSCGDNAHKELPPVIYLSAHTSTRYSISGASPSCPYQDSALCPEVSRTQDVYEQSGEVSERSDSEPGGDGVALLDVEEPVTAVNCCFTNTQPAHSHPQISSDPRWSRRDSSCLSHSHSMPSLSQITSAKTFTRAGSVPDMLLKIFNEYTPDIIDDEYDDTYRFQCSRPGLYRCRVTGLVFHMEGEGDVVYRTVPWNWRLLAQHHKRSAGPLFDIKCVQHSVFRLHLPHCEILSTGGGDFLSVAHVTDEDIEFINPHEITETHVIINITGFSGFGNVKDGDSPAVPVRALVLLFYKPPADPDPESVLNVLLLPRNVVLQDVLRIRKKLDGDERYIETSPHCKLQPNQEYTLSTRPEDDSVLVQPTEAEFDCDKYDNYFPSFQVFWKTMMKHIKLLLRDTNSSNIIWERRACLSSTGRQRSALNLPPHERLMDIRSSFVDSISGPVLKSLLDKLFEKKVMTDSERESADEMPNKRDKARSVIDTVRNKGEAASSEMIEFLCEADPFLSEHLGLI